jgi:hypothetical protein
VLGFARQMLDAEGAQIDEHQMRAVLIPVRRARCLTPTSPRKPASTSVPPTDFADCEVSVVTRGRR